MTPSLRLLVVLGAGLGVAALPALVDVRLWVLFAVMWGALALALGWDLGALWTRRVSVAGRAPARVGVGDEFTLALEVELPARAPMHATLRGEAAPPLELVGDVALRLLPGTSRVELPLRADRRGSGTVRAVWFAFDGPLGLLRRIVRVPLEVEPVHVVPSMRRVRRMLLEHFGGSRFEAGVHVERFRGEGGEFDTLETYVPGMDLRGVDWKATARHQALSVRRFRLERNQRVIVCLDAGRIMGDPIGELTRLDHAVHAGLALAYTALRGGDLVGLHAYDAKPLVFVPPVPTLRHLDRLRTACATLAASDVETNHFLGLRELMTKLTRRSLVVVFTDFTDATMAQLMVENLAHIARRHLVIFVALDDPITEAPLRARPETVEELAAAVVAGELRDARALVLRDLARAGVEVVHGPPTQATLELLSRYVKVKRRGKIG